MWVDVSSRRTLYVAVWFNFLSVTCVLHTFVDDACCTSPLELMVSELMLCVVCCALLMVVRRTSLSPLVSVLQPLIPSY
jgi:hypothetical protein